MPSLAESLDDQSVIVATATTLLTEVCEQDTSHDHASAFSVASAHTERAVHPTKLLLIGCGSLLHSHLQKKLSNVQWSIRQAQGGAEALELLLLESSDLVLLAPQLPDLNVDEVQQLIGQTSPGTQVIRLGAAVAPLREVTTKLPDPLASLLFAEMQPPTYSSSAQEDTVSPSRLRPSVVDNHWQGILGEAPAMQKVFHAARLVAKKNTTVLIEGESGTGKDLLARAIHNASSRARQPFVVINCAAIPEALLEAELFGHTKGAFTGATQSKVGRVHAAHGGTLFLDEIGDMPLPLQSKILRFLEQGELQRIGSTDLLKVDCRVIAATNAALKSAVQAKQFREDLYYRLAVFPMRLPPLRERKEDVLALALLFLHRFAPGCRLRPETCSVLMTHDWPGNVRELRNVMERASLLAEDRSEIFPEEIVL